MYSFTDKDLMNRFKMLCCPYQVESVGSGRKKSKAIGWFCFAIGASAYELGKTLLVAGWMAQSDRFRGTTALHDTTLRNSGTVQFSATLLVLTLFTQRFMHSCMQIKLMDVLKYRMQACQKNCRDVRC